MTLVKRSMRFFILLSLMSFLFAFGLDSLGIQGALAANGDTAKVDEAIKKTESAAALAEATAKKAEMAAQKSEETAKKAEKAAEKAGTAMGRAEGIQTILENTRKK